MIPPRTAAWRPLFDACFAGDHAALSAFLAAGADPNQVARSVWRQRPLHRVCEFRITHPKHAGHDRCIQLLLAAGADPTLRANSTDMRPVEPAALAGMGIAAGLVSPRPADVYAAAALGDSQRIRAILRRHPSAALEPDAAGRTALWYLAASRIAADPLGAAGALLDAGADPNAAGLHVPALHMALAHTGNQALADLLHARGANINANTSIVHSACRFHFQFLREALTWCAARGADFTRRDPDKHMNAFELARFLRARKLERWLQELR